LCWRRLLYLGSGVGLALMLLLRNVRRTAVEPIDRLAGIPWPDVKWLAGATVAGGMLGPALLMTGPDDDRGRAGRAAAEMSRASSPR
jgi:hypothetical protein